MELYVRVFNDMLERDKEIRKKGTAHRSSHACRRGQQLIDLLVDRARDAQHSMHACDLPVASLVNERSQIFQYGNI
jgi:hypothetical protein